MIVRLWLTLWWVGLKRQATSPYTTPDGVVGLDGSTTEILELGPALCCFLVGPTPSDSNLRLGILVSLAPEVLPEYSSSTLPYAIFWMDRPFQTPTCA